MRPALPVLLTVILWSTPRLVMAVDCVPDGTLIERNFCAALAAEQAERDLATALAAARTRAADDPNALDALTAADTAWRDFRDKALAAAFPCYHDDLTVCFGLETARQHALFRIRLARERIAHLDTTWRVDE